MSPSPDKVEIQTTPQKTVATDLPMVMTVDEVASMLRLNRKTVYEMISKGQIPGVVRTGRKIRISRQAVLNWIDGQSRHERRL